MYVEPAKDSLRLPPECISIYNLLIKNEVEEEFAEKLVKLAWDMKEKKGIDFTISMGEVIMESLGKPKPLEIKPGERRTALFLGPTGVGKTTTLAKLAAIYSIQHQKKVGLITADTYRIAAVDQLRIYAQILGIPLSIIYSPDELKDAIKYHEDKDIILIDTAGKSIKNREQEKEINQLLLSREIDEIYLVLGSNISYKGCVNIIESYRFLPDYKLLFTKVDEITSYGIILNCCLLTQKPLSYFTTGQDVPDDIEIVNPEKIKNLLIGSIKV
jgi:flagellar biosynthesis protein FlhF